MFVLKVTLANPDSLKTKPLAQNLTFGNQFTDHMLTVGWNDIGGWKDPKIVPFGNIQMLPAAKVLHYAQELYEGMKVCR